MEQKMDGEVVVPYSVSLEASDSSSSRLSGVDSLKKDTSMVINRSISNNSMDESRSSEKLRDFMVPEHEAPKTMLEYIGEHQISGSLSALVVLAVVHNLWKNQAVTSKFLHLQYQYPGSSYYDIGLDDVYYVLTWIVVLTFIRALLMKYLLEPIATNVSKIKSRKAIQRYKEQGWSFIYYVTSWSLGFYLYYQSEYFMDCDLFYRGWPHDQMSFFLKNYYLIQLACWFQQIFVLNVEERRKDYYQMFCHHIITCFLVTGSYYYYFTRVGHVILVLMDYVDIILPLAKMLKYSGFNNLCDFFFIVFLVNWMVLRHGVYNYLVYHLSANAYNLMTPAHCDSITSSLLKRCITQQTLDVFTLLLCLLQVITLIWMYLILRVFYKVIMGTGADDIRSDSEHD